MPDSPSTARELLVRLPNSRRDVSGCSRVRESSCRLAGLAFRTKRTTAIEPANNGPRFKPITPAPQTQTTQQEPSHDLSPALATAGGLCPPDPPRFSASAPIPESKTETGRPATDRQVSRLRSWHLARRSVRVSAWTYPPAGLPTILSATPAPNHYRCARFEPNAPRWQPRRIPTQSAQATENRTYFGSDRLIRTRYTRS